jgi:hypothetical protein
VKARWSPHICSSGPIHSLNITHKVFLVLSSNLSTEENLSRMINLGKILRWLVSFRPHPFYPLRQSLRYPLAWAIEFTWTRRRRANCFLFPEIQPKSSSLQWVYIMNELSQIIQHFSHGTKFSNKIYCYSAGQEISCFYGSRGFITVSKRARHWYPSKISWMRNLSLSQNFC